MRWKWSECKHNALDGKHLKLMIGGLLGKKQEKLFVLLFLLVPTTAHNSDWLLHLIGF